MSIPRTPGVRAPVRASNSRPTIADWMEQYVAGDPRAFDRLFRVIEPRVRRQIRARIGDELHVDDLVQLTMLRAHAARSSYRRPDHDAEEALVAWFCAIARNTATNFLRGQYRDRLRFGEAAEHAVAQACTVGDDFEQCAVAREIQRARHGALRSAIEALPPGQRVVVLMHKLEGLPIAEVSRALGVRDGAVRVRAHRAYQALRGVMAPTRRAPQPARAA